MNDSVKISLRKNVFVVRKQITRTAIHVLVISWNIAHNMFDFILKQFS